MIETPHFIFSTYIRLHASNSAVSRVGSSKLVDFPFAANGLDSGTSLLGSVVLKCRDLFLGYQAGYDAVSNRVTKNDVGVAYGCADIDLHFRCTCIPHVYGLSVLYRGKRRRIRDEGNAGFP